jgi:L-alanine-DL-glutamate epimerase-like enolase superfamily enzyme
MEGPVRLDHTRYRLRFKHPFGTAHGLRDGTDAVFLRLSRAGATGYGEATLPPYVLETADSVIQAIQALDIDDYIFRILNPNVRQFAPDPLATAPAARAALSTAIWDLEARSTRCALGDLIGQRDKRRGDGRTVVTIGHEEEADIPLRVNALPDSDILKVKLGGPSDKRTLEVVQACDHRPLLIDANQGWNSVNQAMDILEAVEMGRLAGIEQPFPKDRWDLHRELKSQIEAPLLGDESIQGMADLERASEAFSGVNIKLMKCGGLDVAMRMSIRARELDLKVMFGSMSESSLGCSAMAQLQDHADVLDLDGPWLLANDPFTGLGMEPGKMTMEDRFGCGVSLVAGLDWRLIGA